MITNRKAISTQYIEWAISALAENGIRSNATKYTVKHTKLNGETVDVDQRKSFRQRTSCSLKNPYHTAASAVATKPTTSCDATAWR